MEDTVTPLDCHSVTKLVIGPQAAQKRLLVTVCIHGNEICGLLAVNELLREGFFKKGFENMRVTILIGNPRAVMENKRYIDVNLNRMFVPEYYDTTLGTPNTVDPYERSRLEEIISEMDNCDAYLDLHSTSSPSGPFAIVPPGEKSETLAKSFPVEFVLHNVIQAIRGTSVDYLKHLNKPAVCVECGQHRSEAAIRVAKESICTFITGVPTNHVPKKVLYVSRSVILKEGFQFKKPATAFDYVNANELVASDNEGEIRCPYKQGAFLIMPVSNPILGEEAWLWGHEHDLCNGTDELLKPSIPKS